MDVGGPPSVQLRATVQQHFHQPHHPGIVDLDAGDFGFAERDRQRHPLKQREVDVNVRDWASKPAKRSVMATSLWRRHSRFFSPLLSPRAFIRWIPPSTRRKV